MKVVLGLVACCTPLACSGFRLHENPRRAPQAVAKPPVGRHIQLEVDVCCAGLTDRMAMFNWLLDVAHWNNATLHIRGGWKGAGLYLGHHSVTVNTDWSHYVSVSPGCGEGPFNEVEAFEGCRQVYDPDFDWSQPALFSGANGCVRIQYHYFYHRRDLLPRPEPAQRCRVTESQGAQAYARQLVAEKGLPERFGVVHIRRCDSGRTECTTPSNVASAIGNFTDVHAWMIFLYAEPGYRDELARVLACPACNRTIVFEDAMDLNPFQDGDNFYAYQVSRAITKMSDVTMEARRCPGGSPVVVPKSERQSYEEEFLAHDTFAICGGWSEW